MRNVQFQSDPKGGFVLLEALVSLILLSMIIALFATTLTFARRVADTGRIREQMTDVAMSLDVISGWLAGAVPDRQIRAGGESAVTFEGSSSQLSFMTLSNGDTQPGGTLAVTIYVGGNVSQGSGTIAFSSAPLTLGVHPARSGNGGQQVIVRNVLRAEFSYFGSPRDGTPAGWHKNWKYASRLPELISLQLELVVQGRKEALDLAFRTLSE